MGSCMILLFRAYTDVLLANEAELPCFHVAYNVNVVFLMQFALSWLICHVRWLDGRIDFMEIVKEIMKIIVAPL